MVTITTPRPPLNIFDRSMLTANNTQGWVRLYETPKYLIPANGPNPSRTVQAVALLTSLIVAPNTTTLTWAGPLFVSMRRGVPNGLGGYTYYWVCKDLEVPQDDFAVLDLGKQNMPSDDIADVRVYTGASLTATMSADFQLSYIVNQREEYEVIV